MIEVYLNLNGQAAEAAAFYAQVFGASAPYILRFDEMPKEDQGDAPDSWGSLVMHANVKTFAGDIMLGDNLPGTTTTPSAANWINVSHSDLKRLRQVFEGLSEGGEVLMPLESTFFSPLYGQVKDKFGFHWMIMSDEPSEF